MLYFLTNLNVEIGTPLNNVKIVNFNPWGFSRINVSIQVVDCLKSMKINDSDKILVCLKPYFFGRRTGIVSQTLNAIYKNVQVLDCTVFEAQSAVEVVAEIERFVE
jgi:hypothetical protein